jgi:hypothetical protein
LSWNWKLQRRGAESVFEEAAVREQRVGIVLVNSFRDLVQLAVEEDRDVDTIGQPVHQSVDSTIRQREKEMERAAGLLSERCPDTKFEDLP